MTRPLQTCLRFFVSGRVQGVAYRVSAYGVARQLGVRGWVRNLADGRVELVAAGPAPALQKLEQWLHQGPPQARVDQVIREAAEFTEFDGFEIR
jgi:acylphosphatase